MRDIHASIKNPGLVISNSTAHERCSISHRMATNERDADYHDLPDHVNSDR